MGEDERSKEPQPQRRVGAGERGVAQSCERRDERVARSGTQHAGEPDEMQEEKRHQRQRHDPGFDRVERGAAALGHRGEQDERAEKEQRRIAGKQEQRRRSAERVP